MNELLKELQELILKLNNVYCKLAEEQLKQQQQNGSYYIYFNEKPTLITPLLTNESLLYQSTNIDNSISNKKKQNSHNVIDETGENKTMALLNVKGLALNKKQRKDGRYMGRYWSNEEKKYKSFYANSYESLTTIALELINNKKKIVKKNQMTFRQWAEQWLEIYHKEKTAENTFKNNCGIFKNHIFPHLENKFLNSISGLDIQKTINKCQFSRQRQIVANLITACVRKAYEIDLIKSDITKAVEKPSHNNTDTKALTKIEQKNLLNYLQGKELELYITLLLHSGLRRNEALGLFWKHLDFKNNNIIVEQQVDMKNNITKKLKTKTSKRIVKMFPIIKALFQPLKGDNEKRIFLFSPDYVSHEFKKICNELNLNNYSIKGNRTTFATRCAEYGIADKVVQAWLGHSKLDTTVNVYQKTNNEFVEQEFNKIISKFDTDFDTFFDTDFLNKSK